MDKLELIKFKEKLEKELVAIYKKNGYKVFKNSLDNLIKNSTKKAKEAGDKELGIQIRGECCEVLLKISIIEFCKKNKVRDWFMTKGLAIERNDKMRNKTTELDVTLFTPNKIILFESKYRSGKIRLLEECNIVCDFGFNANVYKQNLMHVRALKSYLDECIKSDFNGKPFGITLFMYDKDNVTDKREDNYKKLIPLITGNNIMRYLDYIYNLNNHIWLMPELTKTIKELDKNSSKVMVNHMINVAK